MNKRIKISIIWSIIIILIGIGMVAFTFLMNDEGIFKTMGMAFVLMGFIRLIKAIRIVRNPDAMKKFVQRNEEERIVYIANKSRSLSFVLSIYAQFIVGVIVAIYNVMNVAQGIFVFIAFEILMYIAIYFIYSRKN